MGADGRREDLNHTGSHKINNAVGQVRCVFWKRRSGLMKDPAGEATGKEANHCRDGSRSTRCRHRYCLR